MRRGEFRSRMLRRRQVRVRRMTHFSLNRMIPNILTLFALCAGMTAIRLAFNGKFESAVVAIIIAGVFDGLDGRVARLLKTTSSFGAQLDSLSDFISFGVAPAIVLYAWTMSELHSVGWAIVLFYGVCCGLRLARFNTQLDAELPPYAYKFFTGVPAPAGAGLVLVPMYISFDWGDGIFRSPILNAIVIAGTAALMVSRIPTFSLKRVRVPHHMVVPALLALAVVAAFLTTAPWPLLALVGLAYLVSIPFTLVEFNRLRQAFEATRPATVEVSAAPTDGEHQVPATPH